MEKLSISLEDYIEEIYSQILKTGYAKVTEISKALNVRKASVTGALNALAIKKLVTYTPYSPITLTQNGEKIAENIFKKHKMISEFFVEILGLSKDEALQTACKMEHIVSEKLFENIITFSDFIKAQPENLRIKIKKLY